MRHVAVPDARLLALAGGGDELAFVELYDRFAAVAYGLALRILRDRELAEDAVQEAFLSLWRSAAAFDEQRGSARAWLLTLVHRRAVDLVQRTERHRETPAEWLRESDAPSTAAAAELDAERRRVIRALDALPALQRQALELAYYGGLTQSQIAAQVGVPLGTVKSRMYAALATLRDALAEDPA